MQNRNMSDRPHCCICTPFCNIVLVILPDMFCCLAHHHELLKCNGTLNMIMQWSLQIDIFYSIYILWNFYVSYNLSDSVAAYQYIHFSNISCHQRNKSDYYVNNLLNQVLINNRRHKNWVGAIANSCSNLSMSMDY